MTGPAAAPLPSDFVAAVATAAGRWLGTAFFVGPDVALTAAHVVRAREGAAEHLGAGELRLLPVGGPEPLIVEDVRIDERRDLARLQLGRPVAVWASLQPSWQVDMRVTSHGFSRRYPPDRFPHGHPMNATDVSGEVAVAWDGAEMALLQMRPSNADRGYSGAPVVDIETGGVVGVLRFVHSDDKALYAIPAASVLDRWPDLAEVSGRASEPDRGLSRHRGAWASFDPRKFQAVVVDAETTLTRPLDRLSNTVRELRAQGVAGDIWAAFRRYWQDRRLLSGHAPRALPEQPEADDFRLASIDVRDAYATRQQLAEAVRLVVEADVALFDVTAFEPGVMLLLGVRAATRRGVSIASHGDWQEGSSQIRPFNLSDLALTSHRPVGTGVGSDPRVDLLGQRIVAGFEQMTHLPRYGDLPAYDGLRQLGSRQDAWSTVPLETLVLTLCSYDDAFFETWKMLRLEIADALTESGYPTARVARLVDLRRPQLVSQALYDRIRRCSACVTDWTLCSPSTFFEMGARLAVSPWGSVQIVDQTWFDAQHEGGDGADRAARDDRDDRYPLAQLAALRRIFEPLAYRGKDDRAIGALVAERLVAIRRTAGAEGGHFIRSVVIDALSGVEAERPGIVQALVDEADALHHPEQAQRNAPQTLFPELREAKLEQEDAANQRRIAAWLYLEHRENAGARPPDDPRHQLWREIGEALCGTLYEGSPEDQTFAAEIEKRMDP